MNKKYQAGIISSVIFIVGILSAVILISGCAEKQEQKEVTFAMLPQMSNAQLADSWRPPIAYLESETGLKINQVFPGDSDEYIKWAKEGKIDFGYSNPFVY